MFVARGLFWGAVVGTAVAHNANERQQRQAFYAEQDAKRREKEAEVKAQKQLQREKELEAEAREQGRRDAEREYERRFAQEKAPKSVYHEKAVQLNNVVAPSAAVFAQTLPPDCVEFAPAHRPATEGANVATAQSLKTAVVLADYRAASATELNIRAGDQILILNEDASG